MATCCVETSIRAIIYPTGFARQDIGMRNILTSLLLFFPVAAYGTPPSLPQYPIPPENAEAFEDLVKWFRPSRGDAESIAWVVAEQYTNYFMKYAKFPQNTDNFRKTRSQILNYFYYGILPSVNEKLDGDSIGRCISLEFTYTLDEVQGLQKIIDFLKSHLGRVPSDSIRSVYSSKCHLAIFIPRLGPLGPGAWKLMGIKQPP